MSGFDPSKLTAIGKMAGSARPRPERVFVQVQEYVARDDGHVYAVGQRLGLDGAAKPVEVRLTTVKERLIDWPARDEALVMKQYVNGENPRPDLASKAKSGVPLIAFDEAYKIHSEGDRSIYRAHWPTVMASGSEPFGVLSGMAHIRLRDEIVRRNGDVLKPQAYIELLKGSAVVNKHNIRDVLAHTLKTVDEEGRAKDPVAIVRVFHEGTLTSTVRLRPDLIRSEVMDTKTGELKPVSSKASAQQTLGRLLGPDAAVAAGRDPIDTQCRDMVRALVAGLQGQEEPQYASQDPALLEPVRAHYGAALAGAIQVEVIGAEQIDFGKAARKTYLKDKGQSHLAAYTQESVNGDYINLIPMYTKTVVAVQFHPDGEPYAVFAAPEMMHPITKHRSGMAKLAEIGYAFLEPLEMNEAKVAGADVTAGPTAPLPSNTNSQAPARERSHSEPSF